MEIAPKAYVEDHARDYLLIYRQIFKQRMPRCIIKTIGGLQPTVICISRSAVAWIRAKKLQEYKNSCNLESRTYREFTKDFLS